MSFFEDSDKRMTKKIPCRSVHLRGMLKGPVDRTRAAGPPARWRADPRASSVALGAAPAVIAMRRQLWRYAVARTFGRAGVAGWAGCGGGTGRSAI